MFLKKKGERERDIIEANVQMGSDLLFFLIHYNCVKNSPLSNGHCNILDKVVRTFESARILSTVVMDQEENT